MEDLSQLTFFPTTKAPPQLHDFMPMPPASSRADEEEDRKKADFRSDLKKRMEEFWKKQLKEVTDDVNNGGGRLTHPLPLARIAKIMKMDEDVKLVGAATTMLFVKACEIFIKELTERAWIYTEKKNRKTLQRDEIARALRDDELFSFLHNTVTMPGELATDDESPPPPQEVAANDVAQQIYFPEPYQYHSADRPFSYPMNTPYMNPFDQGSTSAANNPAIDPRIAYELNLHDISPNFMQIGGEIMPPWYHQVAPQPPIANVNPACMNFRQFGDEMNHQYLAPQPPPRTYMNAAANTFQPQPPRPAATFQVGGEMPVDPLYASQPPPSVNVNNSFQIGGQMIQSQSATQPPPRANPNAAFGDYWLQQ